MCARRWNLDRSALAACLAVCLVAPASAALRVPTAAGGWATIEGLTRVNTASVVANLRWTDPLGNVKSATGVTLRRNLPVVAQVAKNALGKRLAVGVVVAGVLYEAIKTALGDGVTIDADGNATTVGQALAWSVCESNLISAYGPDGTTRYHAYAYLPCYKVYVGPERLMLRIPSSVSWRPDQAWLNTYGTGSTSQRALEYLLAGATVATVGGYFMEYMRPQTDSSHDIPTGEAPVTDAQLADALMTETALGQLAQADALPDDFFDPVDLSTGSVDLGEGTTPTDEGSELDNGGSEDMGDVESATFDVRDYLDWNAQWLPRQCPTFDPIVVSFPPFIEGRWDWPTETLCAVLTDYVGPLTKLMALALFVGVVFRRLGGN